MVLRYCAPQMNRTPPHRTRHGAPPVIQAQKPASGNIPVWVWGVVAVPVLAAGIAAAWLIAPKPQQPQTQQMQAEVTQPAVTTPHLADSNANTPLTSSSASQKPSPASPASKTTTSSVIEKPAEADNSKPPIVQPPAIQPAVVNPPAPQPSNAEIMQQALSLYSQRNFSMAAPLFDKACSGGGWEACKDLGIMYRYGQGVMEDDQRAARSLLQSLRCRQRPWLHQSWRSIRKRRQWRGQR